MRGWFILLKKEYRMARTSAFVLLAMLIIAGLWVLYLNRGNMGIILAPASLLIIFGLFYPALFMLKSVYSELKNTPHLWLHCPQPAWMLLSAKLVMAVGVMLAILAVDAVFVYTIIFSTPEINAMGKTGISAGNLALFVTEVGVYVTIAIIGVSIYMAAWSSLMAVATVGSRHVLGRFNWLAGLGVFLIATWGMGKLHSSWLYKTLTKWGVFKINLLSLNKVLPAAANDNSFGGLELYAGEIFAILIATVSIFALSSWLIDNKVEV